MTEITQYVEENIGEFHKRRLQNLQKLKFRQILKRKNPYLFRAKNIRTAEELVKNLLNAHLSSQEEAIFGEFLEGLAIFVCHSVYGGRKSIAEGIDLEFEKAGQLYLVAIKSGPNWGNSSQIKKLIENFKKAQKILRTSGSKAKLIAVNGCCYGQDNQPDKGDYFKLCGQSFWELISGNDDLYLQIIEPLGHNAKHRNDEFENAYYQIIDEFSKEVKNHFCDNDGTLVNWVKLLHFNSAKTIS